MADSRRYLIVLVAFLGVFAIARAQAGPVPEATKEVSLQFSVFALGGAEGIGFQAQAGTGPRALKFFSAYRSPQYAYHGVPRMCFFDTTTGDTAPPVAVYEIPEGAGNLLLLFFPKETPTATGIKYDVIGVDDRVERTPGGHFTTINVSGREYVAQYGANRILIPQGVGAVHTGKGRVSLMLAAQVEGQWMPTGRHDFSMSATDRVTLIFYPPASRTGVYPIIRRLVDAGPDPLKQTGAEVVQD